MADRLDKTLMVIGRLDATIRGLIQVPSLTRQDAHTS